MIAVQTGIDSCIQIGIVIFGRELREKGDIKRMSRWTLCGYFATSFAVTSLLFPFVSHSDILHSENVIINDSLAIGGDAVTNENFGADTLRLKENNLRIHFDDTSSGGGFARNDWRILINDQASGGTDYFAIEDSTAARIPFRIEAAAPTDALRVDSAGNVGFGTDNPITEQHIRDGDSPTIRLEQDRSDGFTAQTWDVVGNEVNFYIRNVTHGSTLPFRISTNSANNVLTIMGNRVGVNTFSPASPYSLHVNGDTLVSGKAFLGANIEIGSSRKGKNDIRDLTLEEAQEALHMLAPIQYRYKTSSELQLGFVAEDVPDLVATDTRESVSPMDFIAVLTKVLQEQQKVVEEQQKQLDELEQQLRNGL